MAIYDAMFEFSDAQTVAFAAGSAEATNVIDLQNNDLNIGAGTPLYLNVRVETACAQVAGAINGDRTLKIDIVTDEDATIDASSRKVWASQVWTEPNLTAGAWLVRMPLPIDIDKDTVNDGGNDGRYLGLFYTTTGTHATATGTVNAWLDNGSQSDYNVQVSNSNI